MNQNNINQYEILSISDGIVLVRHIRPICLEKAKLICEHISRRTKKNAFWFNNLETDEIDIYTEKGNLKEAKDALEEFEAEYKSCLRKRQMIINQRHKK